MNLFALLQHLSVAQVVSLVVSFGIPAVSALLARVHWPAWLVGLLSLTLAAVNGFGTEWAQAGASFQWKTAVGGAIFSYALALLGHYGIVKGDLYGKLLSLGSGLSKLTDTGPGTIEEATPPANAGAPATTTSSPAAAAPDPMVSGSQPPAAPTA